jgi:L-ascorbate metabolism protein UlaG (beta-lactamase superfamily)
LRIEEKSPHALIKFVNAYKFMKFTYYGHSCFSLEINGKNILFDPFITKNELAKEIDIKQIKADYVLISHGHFDHVDDAETIAKATGAKIVSNWEISQWFASRGIENYHPMNTGGKWSFDFGSVKCVTANHSSSLPDGSYGGNPMGFVIDDNNEKCLYYSGDTALTLDMQLIPLTSKKLNCGIFPIGDNFTMGIDDAVLAAEFCKVNTVIGVHYDTFGFIKIDHNKAIETFAAKGIKLILPTIGETIEI